MKYLKIYEEFIVSPKKGKEVELSDKTIDDVLKPDFFDDVKDQEDKEKDKKSHMDKKGVIHIKNWNTY